MSCGGIIPAHLLSNLHDERKLPVRV